MNIISSVPSLCVISGYQNLQTLLYMEVLPALARKLWIRVKAMGKEYGKNFGWLPWHAA